MCISLSESRLHYQRRREAAANSKRKREEGQMEEAEILAEIGAQIE